MGKALLLLFYHLGNWSSNRHLKFSLKTEGSYKRGKVISFSNCPCVSAHGLLPSSLTSVMKSFSSPPAIPIAMRVIHLGSKYEDQVPQSKGRGFRCLFAQGCFSTTKLKLDPVGEREGGGSMEGLKHMGRQGKFNPTRRGIGKSYCTLTSRELRAS